MPAIVQSEFGELKMIGSRSKRRGKKFAEEFDCKNFGSYDEVLENNEIDAVYISVQSKEEITAKIQVEK